MHPFTTDKDLARLLVLVPYLSRISEPTRAMLDAMIVNYARVFKLPGKPTALARCLLAGAAVGELERHAGSDGPGPDGAPWDVVLWLDADMYTEAPVLMRQLNHLVELVGSDFVSPAPHAVSGLYCRRTEPSKLAGSRYDRPLRYLADGSVLVPGHTGMGCFAQTASSLLMLCDLSRQCVTEDDLTYPAICREGPEWEDDFEARLVWRSQDWHVCEKLWSMGVPVYWDTTAPWGHLYESIAVPQGIPDGLLTPEECASVRERDRSRSAIDAGSSALTP
jgi:hypothetical protein